MLTEPFVCQEEEHFLFLDRPADRAAEVISLEWRLRDRCSVRRSDRIEIVPRV